MRHQPRTKQKKYKLSTSTINRLNECVLRDVIRWNCSRSWIIASALAAFYGVDIVRPYETKRFKTAKTKVIRFRKRA
jgi:hypothetical protein